MGTTNARTKRLSTPQEAKPFTARRRPRRLNLNRPHIPHLGDKTLSTIGLGSQIDQATDADHFPILLLATILIPLMVVSMNRLVWRRLYHLAETKYKLLA